MRLLDISEQICTMLLVATMVASLLGWLQVRIEGRTRFQEEEEIDIFGFEPVAIKRRNFFTRNIRRPKWNPPLESITEEYETAAKSQDANSARLAIDVPAHEQAGGSEISEMPTSQADAIDSKPIEPVENKESKVTDAVNVAKEKKQPEDPTTNESTRYIPPPQEATSPRKNSFSFFLKFPKFTLSCFQPITSSLDEDIKLKECAHPASSPGHQIDQALPEPASVEPIQARHRRTVSRAVTEFEAIFSSDLNLERKNQLSSTHKSPSPGGEGTAKLTKLYRRKFRPFRFMSKIPSSSKLRHSYPTNINFLRN